MTSDSKAPPAPWGILATTGWAVLAGIASVIASVAVLVLVEGFDAFDKVSEDGRLFSIVTLPSTIALIAVLVAAARQAGWAATDYLGLVRPSRRDAAIATAIVACLAIGSDILTRALGRDVITQFQVDLYNSARNAGYLVWLWIAVVVAAPLGEEIVFRGFLYRGWVRSARSLVPATIIIAALWAVLHSQYDWYDVAQIFVLGLALGWVRWRSGSTLLTFGLHAAINAWATLQTMARLW